MNKIMIFTMHGTTPWWTYLARNLSCADSTVVISDLRGDGDVSVVNDFYRYMRSGDSAAYAISQLGKDVCNDVILRCRTLRSLKRPLALRMIGGMWQALLKAFLAQRPNLVLSFTIDRYVMDLLERIARQYGIQFLEMTTSILPNRIMFLQRGRLVHVRNVDDSEVDAAIQELAAPDFAPSYVRDVNRFSALQFWKVFLYFELRGAAFNLIRWIRRDPLNLHYLDAQKSLKHKVRVGDYAALKYFDHDWNERLRTVARNNRVFLGLQLFPEASLDYWLNDAGLLDHDEVILEICEALSAAGFHIFVKDHPLQFGFRQKELIERLSKVANLTLVPYGVNASYLLSSCRISVTLTGTLGFQAAMAGLISVVSDPYYANDENFIKIKRRADISMLPRLIHDFLEVQPLAEIRKTLTRRLLSSNLPGDYFSFQNFNPARTGNRQRVDQLLESLNAYLPCFMREFGHTPQTSAANYTGHGEINAERDCAVRHP